MKGKGAALAAVLLVCGVIAQDKWTNTSSGSFKIDRFWEETVGDYTCTYTIVTYRNTTDRTFTSAVTIQATIYDNNDKTIDMNERSFFFYEIGPIKPGFEDSVKIPIECARGQSKSVSVRIKSAR
jgi:hypothetical protein